MIAFLYRRRRLRSVGPGSDQSQATNGRRCSGCGFSPLKQHVLFFFDKLPVSGLQLWYSMRNATSIFRGLGTESDAEY